MATSRPRLLWFVMVFFLWSVGKDFQLLYTHRRSVDFYIFDLHGLSVAFYAIASATFLLDLAASYSIFSRTRRTFRICLAALILGMVYNFVALALALDDLPGVRKAYLEEREMRGLPANPETADRIFTPEGMAMTMGIGILFSLIGIAALVKVRRFFIIETRSQGRKQDAV